MGFKEAIKSLIRLNNNLDDWKDLDESSEIRSNFSNHSSGETIISQIRFLDASKNPDLDDSQSLSTVSSWQSDAKDTRLVSLDLLDEINDIEEILGTGSYDFTRRKSIDTAFTTGFFHQQFTQKAGPSAPWTFSKIQLDNCFHLQSFVFGVILANVMFLFKPFIMHYLGVVFQVALVIFKSAAVCLVLAGGVYGAYKWSKTMGSDNCNYNFSNTRPSKCRLDKHAKRNHKNAFVLDNQSIVKSEKPVAASTLKHQLTPQELQMIRILAEQKVEEKMKNSMQTKYLRKPPPKEPSVPPTEKASPTNKHHIERTPIKKTFKAPIQKKIASEKILRPRATEKLLKKPPAQNGPVLYKEPPKHRQPIRLKDVSTPRESPKDDWNQPSLLPKPCLPFDREKIKQPRSPSTPSTRLLNQSPVSRNKSPQLKQKDQLTIDPSSFNLDNDSILSGARPTSSRYSDVLSVVLNQTYRDFIENAKNSPH